MQNNPLMASHQQFPGFGGANDMLDLCIDEPAKRLFSPNGGFNGSQQHAQFRLGGAQYGPNSQIAQRIRDQQILAGVPDALGLMPNDEPKPYRCPVIGCEKAYKNQNGLKYHKSVGNAASTIICGR
jgi:transcription factor SFP1